MPIFTVYQFMSTYQNGLPFITSYVLVIEPVVSIQDKPLVSDVIDARLCLTP